MPLINCTHQVPAQFNSSSSTGQLVVKNTWPTRRVSYIRVMSAADIGDWAVIRCETTFVYREWDTGPQAIDRLPDIPRYHHTWRSSPIRVFNTTGNTRSTGKSLKAPDMTRTWLGRFSRMDAIATTLHGYGGRRPQGKEMWKQVNSSCFS